MRKRLWLCLPPLVMYAADLTLTLVGQPWSYWQGDYASVQELNPIGSWLLLQGPIWFAAAAVLWGVAFVALLLLWRSSWVVVAAFLLTLGHAIGAATWVWRHGPAGMVGAVVVMVLAERLLNLSWRRFGVSVFRAHSDLV